MLKRFTYAAMTLLIVACSSSDSNEEIPNDFDPPKVNTTETSQIMDTTARVSAEIVDHGGVAITEYGVVWGMSGNPTMADNKEIGGNGNIGNASFTVILEGLEASTKYYVRAYAINQEGTSYGQQLEFTTEELGTKILYGSAYLKSQTDVDNLGAQGYTKIYGTLNIIDSNSPASITNVDALSTIEYIGEGLEIYQNGLLENLDGLSNLKELGGHLAMGTNAKLQNLDALTNLTKVGGISFHETSLINIDGLQNISELGSIFISSNWNLTEINVFQDVEFLTGDLHIGGNPELTSITGLNSLTSVKKFKISHNDKLSSLSSFQALTHVAEKFEILENPLLPIIDGFGNLLEVGSDFSISNNGSLSQISTFPNLTSVNGYLTISGNDVLPTISGFLLLKSINGWIRLMQNPQLKSIQGFDALETVVTFQITSNESLEDINGFSSLASIEEHFDMTLNQSLRTVSGLTSLKSIGKTLWIWYTSIEELTIFSNLENTGEVRFSDNPVLSSLKGLAKLKSTQGFHIERCMNLTDLEDLSALESIDGDLEFYGNNNLMSLDGLESLQSITGNLDISYNYQLSNLDGLSSLTDLGGNLTVFSNEQLANFCGLSNSLENGWNGECAITENLFNPSCSEIAEGNCSN